MNPYHDKSTGHFASKGGGSKGSGAAKAPKAPKAAAVPKGKMKTLKRPGNVSVRGGSSKEMLTMKGGQMVSKGVKTVFSPEALKATLHRVATSNKKNPYRAATIITQRGAFQASVGKNIFHGGSKRATSLARPSIGKGFGMTSRGK